MPRPLGPTLVLLGSAVILAYGRPALLAAQGAAPPRAAVAVGWSPAAGLIGGELVWRPASARPLGFAAGAGLAGPGARVHLALGRGASSPAARRVPYVGVGVLPVVWAPVTSMRAVATVEAGVQVWPAARGRAYVDVGGGAALVARYGGGTYAGPALRALVGVAF